MISKKQSKKSYSEKERRLKFIESLRVVEVGSKIAGFFHGMNPLAAKELGVPYSYGINTVAVLRNDPDKEWLIYHESIEYYYMKFKRLSYREAHAQSLLDTKDVPSKKEGLLDAKKMLDWRKSMLTF